MFIMGEDCMGISFLKSLISHFSRTELFLSEPSIVNPQFDRLKNLYRHVFEPFIGHSLCLRVQYTDQGFFLQFGVDFIGVDVVQTEGEEGALIVDGQKGAEYFELCTVGYRCL